MILAGILVILAACTKYEIPKLPCPEEDKLPDNVSYSADVQPIFDQKCVLCHSGGQAPDLRPDWSYDELTDGGYVDDGGTGVPCETPLYETLSGSHADRITEFERDTIIVNWMYKGAEDN